MQFPRIDSNHNLASLNNNGLIDDSLLNMNHDTNRNQNLIWNKDKLNKNEASAFPGIVFNKKNLKQYLHNFYLFFLKTTQIIKQINNFVIQIM